MREGQKRDFARHLRSSMTDAEQALWRRLRRRQAGCRFRRQVPIGPFIADFACIERRLVIELDGGQHQASRTDPRRDAWLRRRGYRVLRFWNTDVLQNMEGVLAVVLSQLAAGPPIPAFPRKRGEGRSHDPPHRPRPV